MAKQSAATVDPVVLHYRLADELPQWTYQFFDERQLHDGLAVVLDHMRVVYRREAVAGSDRYDFLCDGGVVIEAKIKGSMADALRQVERYCRSDLVTAVLIVAARSWATSMHGVLHLHGKPVRVIRLMGAL